MTFGWFYALVMFCVMLEAATIQGVYEHLMTEHVQICVMLEAYDPASCDAVGAMCRD